MTARSIESPPELVRHDPYLAPFKGALLNRMHRIRERRDRLTGGELSLPEFASGHEHFGLHRTDDGWVLREWAPNASKMVLIGMCNNWQADESFRFQRISDNGTWELHLPANTLDHGQLYKLLVEWPGGSGERIPAYARRVVQDEHSHVFCAQVWHPPEPYAWQSDAVRPPLSGLRVYEAHVGMAQEEGRVGTYSEFRRHVLPRIADAGYNTIQLMAVQEHPYYGSFGYHVSNFFAASSRFGTPEELKALVDAAHQAGLAVIIDLVHSHAARNEVEGLSRFDGTLYQYFHEGPRGFHRAWDSRCFDYSKPEVLHFLLSNCRFWLDEYRFDGFRFDGITSMLYFDHGLGKAFTNYGEYFGGNWDQESDTYLGLANDLIHAIRPDAVTVAEDMSGMPGLAAPVCEGGLGFDYRLAMGVPDFWIRTVKETSDEHWHVGTIYKELMNRRPEEKTINYAESHDQALVGDKTLIFRLIDQDMYTSMSRAHSSLIVERGVAVHKMIRLMTLATAGGGYLTFMGNEFGHPEWIDFPREGNGWSYHYARRQWHLRDDPNLFYHCLADFDQALMNLDEQFHILEAPGPDLCHEHADDQVLGFQRAGLLFLCNFNPTRSFADYRVAAPPGRYRLQLDTDSPVFGGHARVAAAQEYTSTKDAYGTATLPVYLPTRTALVLRTLTSDS